MLAGIVSAIPRYFIRKEPWMHQALKDAITISKTLLRNGYDAHVINAPLQEHLLENATQPTVDIACEPDLDTLIKLFPRQCRSTTSALWQRWKKTALFSVFILWK